MRKLSEMAGFLIKRFGFHWVMPLIGLAFAALCAASCDLPSGSAYNAEKGTIRLVLPGGNSFSRSLSDDFISHSISYKLTFTGPGETLKLEPPLPPVVTLKIGTWAVEANAYDTASRLVGTGNITINVTAGPNNPINIPMMIDPIYKAYYEELPDIYIHNEAELRRIGTDFAIDGTKIFHLERDIVLTAPWTPIGDYTTPFEAVFDGGGHSITIGSFTGANVTAGEHFAYVGFLGLVDNAAISNVTINYTLGAPVDFTYLDGLTYSDQHAGGVAGFAIDTSFTDIQVSGSFSVKGNGVSSLNLGGIVGTNNYGTTTTITNCHIEGDIAGETVNALMVGGIAGNSVNVTISGSSFKGSISGLSPTGNGTTGGIAGFFADGEITACFAEGRIETEADDSNVGGIVGRANNSITGVTIKNCYASGIIKGTATGSSSDSHSGGIAGYLNTAGVTGVIENCYAYANVISSGTCPNIMAGGIAGTNLWTISRCYAAGTVESMGTGNVAIHVGGIMGYDNAGIGVTVIDCMALVSVVDAGPSTAPTKIANAICASSAVTLSGNYSRDDIVLQNNTNTTPAPGPNNEAGQATAPTAFITQTPYTAAGWTFGDTGWKFISGYDYPVLSWQTRPPVLP
ncbi:hypothetical protein LQZ19_00235 [Treponema primitia]|uniref:hypothetical protein n=1 Tax=Treponema primitia TaxID=88058 RepID=UPI00397EC625